MNRCQCGAQLGMPGPPQVKMVRDGKIDAESTFVHDLPGVTEMVLATICMNCHQISHYRADVAAMKELVDGCEVVSPQSPEKLS